ncbi:host-nuclease inhibitor Gam family protein [Pasteurella multocida]|uniref:host-nuclease inhibitor Gam family protein n=1 Tax=Pasteurella multocida TaxID=747 RepID=UPI00035445D4|nr:host-nuclease inhibitor Gam family protein [Pasteurella multocida]AWW56557.1 host-nuclease inhibitor protein Gam [Pasteurella multocida]EPE64161.1 mu nuclease inhibitor gam-like protein [Pasteurella multocida P1933]MCL7838018.1 host-nuclease inhibitor Gam family protein [Pasteurella multocida]MCL7843481.1 host-nuclease inhibitor Gam family protein [Pasteurella multocida]MDX3887936.1 host-nuclease inhibitor Gam family protein [Pasteurella multocida]
MAKKATRIKTDTFAVRYQTKDEVEVAIKEIGDLNREMERLAIEQNDRLAQITEEYAPLMNIIKEQLQPKQEAVQAWCESHRDELTQNGKTKTANFNTGDVQWRARPPSVQIRGAESVLESLRTLGLNRFIRTKEEPNKEAMLNEPELAATVAGVTIRKGVEDFVITPFEQEVK